MNRAKRIRKKAIKKTIWASDFETVVTGDPNQDATAVWAAAIAQVGTSSEAVTIYGNIEDLFSFFESRPESMDVYFHNLKFDGSFILDYFLRSSKYKQGIRQTGGKISFKKPDELNQFEYIYSISDKGQWYTITYRKKNDKYVTIKDSVKLFPFTLEAVGEAFQTKHRKLDMEYLGDRYPNCPITPEERDYIKNDVLVLKEALEFMFSQGHNKLTIGSCALSEFRGCYDKEDYKWMFPNLYKIPISPDLYDYDNAGDYIRRAYRGAWTYLKKGEENKHQGKGFTYDVNSLYPYVMSGDSNNLYPVGKPCFWSGNYIPDKATAPNRTYYIRIRTSFRLKKGMLPTIQIKGNWMYPPREFLYTSDYLIDGKYCSHEVDENGKLQPVRVTLTLTKADFELIQKHYKLYNFEILDGCWFFGMKGIFDEYIGKYKRIKEESSGAMRTLAKLFLNNLYGKFASSEDSSFKYAYMDGEDVKLTVQQEKEKEPGYIAIGAFITSYARVYTITHAQNNYDRFIYADTDSLHMKGDISDVVGIREHETEFGAWKNETKWSEGIFVRAKTYIEKVYEKDGKPKEPYYSITCAGMPDRSKRLFELSINQDYTDEDLKKYRDDAREFVSVKRSITDFKAGLCVPGKLMPKRIKGGLILADTTFEIR